MVNGVQKDDIVHYKRNPQQIRAVGSPSILQTPEPSLLFPSIIAAFLTGSAANGLGHGSQVVESTEEGGAYAPKYG